MNMDTIIMWASAFFALIMFSFLYKDNPLFKFGESTFIGLQTGIGLYLGLKSIYYSSLVPISQGDYMLLVPVFMALCVYALFSEKYKWISRYPIYFSIGIGAGLATRTILQVAVISQITPMIKSLTAGSAFDIFSNLTLLIGVICVMSYFIATKEHTGLLSYTAKMGRYLIMIAAGARFGTSLFFYIGITSTPFFVMFEAPGLYLTAIAVLIVIADIIRTRGRQTVQT
jgi:hypothetical protein